MSNNIVRYHPLSETNLTLYPIPVTPAPAAAWDLSTSSGRTEPLQKLFWYHQTLGIPEEERLFGLFDSSIPAGGYTGWAKTDLRSAWTMPTGSTPSHEAGHLTGLQHVDCVGSEEDGGALDPTHPNAAPNCSLAPVNKAGYFGLSVFDTPFAIYSNDPQHPKAAFPLMSYADVKWNDAYHWCKMLTYYDVSCSPEAIGVPGKPIPNPVNKDVDCDKTVAGPNGIELKVCLSGSTVVPAKPTAWVLVSGLLTKNGGTISRAAIVSKAPSPPPTGGANEIVVEDSAGNVLARVPAGELNAAGDLHAAGNLHAHGDGGKKTGVAEFAAVVPVAGDVATIKLNSGGKTLATKQISKTAPAITDLTATPGADGVRIRWGVNDPDGDPVTSNVFWSADGTKWLPVSLQTTQTSVLVGSGIQLPGGGAVRVKVVANDGMRTSEAISTPFTLKTNSPLVAIGELPDGSTIPRYFIGELTALAYDPEQGHLPGTAIAWRSDKDGDLGTGASTWLRRLSAGEHTITATATDSSGAAGTDTIRLTVVDTGAPAPRMPGALPDAERRLFAGSPVTQSLTVLWMGLGGLGALAGLVAVWFYLRRRRVPAMPKSVELVQ